MSLWGYLFHTNELVFGFTMELLPLDRKCCKIVCMTLVHKDLGKAGKTKLITVQCEALKLCKCILRGLKVS